MLSSELKLKLDLFNQQEKQIKELQRHLDALRAQQAILKLELAPYHVILEEPHPVTQVDGHPIDAATYTEKDTPIQRCPDDVLLLIFNRFLDSDHSAIWRLLVCRRWYHLVMKTARLWARIQINDPILLFILVTRKSVLSYVDASLERSNGLALDVHLNLRQLPSCSDYILSEINGVVDAVIDDCRSNRQSGIYDEINSIPVDCISSRYDVQFDRALATLFGPENKDVERWTALTLILPEADDFACDIWERFVRHLPELTSLEVSNFPTDYDGDKLPEFQSLQSLIIHGRLSIRLFGVSATRLETLHIQFYKDLSHLEELNQLVSLRTLKLTGGPQDQREPPRRAQPLFRLYLPSLRKLIVEENYSALSQIQFDLPILDTFSILGGRKLFIVPKVSAPHICWLPYDRDFLRELDSIAKSTVDTLLSHSTSIQSLTIRQFAKMAALRAITDGIEKGILPNFTHLMIEHEDGWLEKVDTLDSAGMLAIVQEAS